MVRVLLLASAAALLFTIATAAPQRPREPVRGIMHDVMEIGMMPVRLTMGALMGGCRMIHRGVIMPMQRGARNLMPRFRSTFTNQG